MHAYLTLPSSVFIDRYQFTDDLFLKSQNIIALRALSGSQDLEAPDWVVKSWGSAALFELALPSAPADGEWTATIPTHLRYVSSSANSSSLLPAGKRELSIPAPAVFWACNAEEGTKFKTNPFDRDNLGYDGLFGTRTMFYHVPPAPVDAEGGLLLGLEAPVLEAEGAGWVVPATVVVIVLGFAWVVFKMVGGGVND